MNVDICERGCELAVEAGDVLVTADPPVAMNRHQDHLSLHYQASLLRGFLSSSQTRT